MTRKLGRGLDSLIEQTKTASRDSEGALNIEVARIRPNPYQPREVMDESAIDELCDSIREHGVLQPVLVRVAGQGFELVAGERRWRATKKLGLELIPALVKDVDDDRMLEIALVENIQREDLNPIEKARAYGRYVAELEITHEEAARRLGKERSTVTNQLRLLELSDDIQAMVSRGTIAMGHARALLGLESAQRRRDLAHKIEKDGLSVRETERLVRETREAPAAKVKPVKVPKSAHFQDLERRLRERFATKAHIDGGRKRGRVSLEYYSMDELTRILDLLLDE